MRHSRICCIYHHTYIRATPLYVLDTDEYNVPMYVQKFINTCQFNKGKYRIFLNFTGVTPQFTKLWCDTSEIQKKTLVPHCKSAKSAQRVK